MAGLEDLRDDTQEETLSLADLNEEEGMLQEKMRVPHPVSNMNRAAQAALLSERPEDAFTNYRLILDELNENMESSTEDMILSEKKKKAHEKTGVAVYDILTDPSLSDEQKKEVMDQYANAWFDKKEVLVEDSVIAESNEKTLEAQTVRVGIADVANTVAKYNEDQQRMVNAVVTDWDGGNAESTFEFLELVTPYAEWNHLRRINKEFFGEEGKASLISTFWMGERKQEIRDHLASLTPEERLKASQKLMEIIQANDRILLQSDNDYASYIAIQDMLDGEYTSVDKWIDNITGALDIIAAGGAVRRLGELAGHFLSTGKHKAVVGGAQPTSVAQVYQDTNKKNAELTHDEMMKDESGEFSQTMYGSPREDAIVTDLANTVEAPDGSIPSRPYNLGVQEDLRLTPNADVMDFTSRGGDIHFFKEEKEEMRSLVVDRVADALGIKNRAEMMTVKETPKGVKISAIYGPKDQGYLNPKHAVEQAKYALRHYGITDKDLILMENRGGRYHPIEGDNARNLIENEVDGNYLVRVDYDYKFNPWDTGKWLETDVKFNFLDRVKSLSQIKAQRHVIDPASMLHGKIVRPASVAVERAAGLEQELLELGKDFTDMFVKFKNDRRVEVFDYLKRNNREGLAPNRAEMKAKGFSDEEMASVYKWKEYWDTAYHLENADLATSLRNQGYQLLEDAKTDTRLIAKPVSRQQAGSFARAYDPLSGEVKSYDPDQLSALYEEGGSLNKLKRPSSFGGDDVIEYVVTDNMPTGTYLRGINDTDTILNYRQGYFHVSYDAPWFIDEVVRDAAGKEKYRRAVAVAGSVKEAEHVRDRMRTSNGGEYEFRENRKDVIEIESEDGWDLATMGGRSAQRARGKRLEGADAPASIVNGNDYILSPVDAMIESAKSISRRTAMRPYLDTVKQRFISQHGHLLDDSLRPFPDAPPKFPSDVSQIKKKTGPQSDKDIADARTEWEFINSLENGYRNSIDDTSKAFLRSMAEILGKRTELGEKSVRTLSEARGVSKQAKALSFEVYLALSPLRQALVQSHQSVMLASNFGKYGSDNIALLPKNMGKLAADTIAMTLLQMSPKRVKWAAKISGRSEKEIKQMYKDFKASGLSAGVSKQSLVNDSLSSLAEQAAYNRNKSMTKQIRLFMQKAGFEVGERINITSAWLAYRDRALREGLELNDEVLDEVTASARNYTYNMNAAGEMPYNQNSLAVLFQFFQVPHKAMLQLTNRQLSKSEKARLLAFQGAMFGMPASFVYDTFSEHLPDDPDVRDNIVSGLEGVMINSFLSAISDQEVKLDYKSLAPVDMLGTYAFVDSLFEANIPDMIANSPSGQMLLGSNPRIVNLIKTVGRYTGAIRDFEDPTTYKMVAEEFFSTFSSGYSNYHKARMAHEYARKVSSVGNVSDKQVAPLEAAMQIFGFRTMDEMKRYYISQKAYEATDAWKQDVKQLYKDVRIHLAKKGISPDDMEYESKVLAEGWAAFGEDATKARQYFTQLMRGDAKRSAEGSMIRDILRIAEMDGGIDDARAMVNALPTEYEDQRSTLTDAINFIEKQNQELSKE